MGKTKEDARNHLLNQGVPLGQNFHALCSRYVDGIVIAAKKHGYRKPKNANGSLARCFYEYANRGDAR